MHRNIRETQTADANASRAGTGVQELDLLGGIKSVTTRFISRMCGREEVQLHIHRGHGYLSFADPLFGLRFPNRIRFSDFMKLRSEPKFIKPGTEM
jgi:hypothetical protein